MAGNATSKNLIAVIIGAVVLFGAISVLPIVIMRRHRRRAAQRHANELAALHANGCMRQVSVQRWLEQQRRHPSQAQTQTPDNDTLERYAGESCPICLTALLAPAPAPGSRSQSGSALSASISSSTIQSERYSRLRSQISLRVPEEAHLSNSHLHPHSEYCISSTQTNDNNVNDDFRTRSKRGPSSSSRAIPPETSTNTPDPNSHSFSGVLILTRCSHVFHTHCLASWFEYRRVGEEYRCPMCKDVLDIS